MRIHEKYTCGTNTQLTTGFSKTVNTQAIYVGRWQTRTTYLPFLLLPQPCSKQVESGWSKLCSFTYWLGFHTITFERNMFYKNRHFTISRNCFLTQLATLFGWAVACGGRNHGYTDGQTNRQTKYCIVIFTGAYLPGSPHYSMLHVHM